VFSFGRDNYIRIYPECQTQTDEALSLCIKGIIGACGGVFATAMKETMEYRLEIYGLGSDEDCIKAFSSTSPFLPFHVGDLLDTPRPGDMPGQSTSSLERSARDRREIRSRNRSVRGIIHRVLIHTEGVVGAAGHRAHEASYFAWR
jgi:hypothetical protein